ncbi:AraC family transcriptional regulator [Nocardioides sp. TF02-7]|uniref:AraC family transcriptional regulator n=1 Tax=Nocardioides sp. TF02-7 TaxID=2917724 RepID=UPI001F06F7CF|nr:AraC family transcriptional regulator [Nocardioides sp. TF02-7]UMG94420.1 AraC family transcriptional regulator [Nocardioides sp. TF02-7]
MAAPDRVAAWRPRLPGVAEVLHAAWHDHAYPAHTHDTWTVLIVDDGLIGYGLDRHEHAAAGRAVTVLPPHVPHDGRTVTADGFRKRVVYLDEDVLGERLVGPAVDGPLVPDRSLWRQVSLLDGALVAGDDLEAEARLALVVERLRWHLQGRPDARPAVVRPSVAGELRDILDADPVAAPSLAEAARRLGVGETHLVRAFTRTYGLPPHRYVVGRRLDLARRLLLDGHPPAEVATVTGFYDQAHLTRHFRRLLRTTPGRYQRSGS